jgi:hypothetical protein
MSRPYPPPEDANGTRVEYVYIPTPPQVAAAVGSDRDNSNILLLMLFLVFLCMVALAVALCRVGRIERSVDTLVQHQSWGSGGMMAPQYGQMSPPWMYYQ